MVTKVSLVFLHVLLAINDDKLFTQFNISVTGVCKTMSGISTERHKFSLS